MPSEGLKVSDLGDGTYRLLEPPFFVNNVACGDVVRATADMEKVLWVDERISWGGHQTIRVTPRRDGSTATCADVLTAFAAVGLAGEELDEYDLVTFDVQPGTPLQPIRDLLARGDADARWWFEEACVGNEWPARSSV